MRQALDPDALERAVLRTRRPGDRIRPLGCGDKLLSDYFIDKKVDRPLRDVTPLVAVGGRVHWVVRPGHLPGGQAERARGDEAGRGASECRSGNPNKSNYNGGKHHAQ